MDDLRSRFASLDQVRVPDLWDTIEVRAAALGSVQLARPIANTVPDRSPGLGERRSLVRLMLAATLVLALVAGAVLVGSGLVKLPTIVPVEPSPPPSVQASPSVKASPSAASKRFVFYTVFDEVLWAGELWVASADGTGAHQLLDGAGLAALAPDGSRLVHDGSLYEVVGPEPRLANARVLSCAVPDCVMNGFRFSPDGTRLAFVSGVNFTPAPGEDANYGRSVIAIMDLATGNITELQSTAVEWPQGVNVAPSWSPDGHSLTFARSDIWDPWPPRRGQYEGRELYVVNADGSGLRRLVRTNLSPGGPSWTPDGARIVFTSFIEWRGLDATSGERALQRIDRDIYSVLPDGTDLRRLTDDTAGPRVERGADLLGARALSWTRDGRLIIDRHLWQTEVVVGDIHRGGGSVELWVMDADGRNQQRLDPANLSSLTAAECVACPYPPALPDSRAGTFLAYWQPPAEAQP